MKKNCNISFHKRAVGVFQKKFLTTIKISVVMFMCVASSDTVWNGNGIGTLFTAKEKKGKGKWICVPPDTITWSPTSNNIVSPCLEFWLTRHLSFVVFLLLLFAVVDCYYSHTCPHSLCVRLHLPLPDLLP